MGLHILNPYQPMIRKHQLPFCNATEGSLLPFLPILIVRITFDDALLRDMEHAAGSRFVDFTLAAKFFQYPFFVCQPCQHARLNSRKVRHEKTASIFWNERRADQLRERTGNGGKERIQQFLVAGFHNLPRQIQIRQMILREVLCLHEPSCPSACAVRPVELQKTMYAPVFAHAARHGLVLFDAGFAQFQPQIQQFSNNSVRLRRLFLHDLPGETLHGHILIRQPRLQLVHTAGVFQPCQFLGPLTGCLRKYRIDRDGVFHELLIHAHTSVVDLLIQRVQLPLLLGQGILFQRFSNGALGFHVLNVILLIYRPLFRRVGRQVSRSAAIGFGGLAGDGEVADEVFAFLHLLRRAQGDGGVRQSSRQRQVRRHDHGAAPLMRIQPVTKIARQAYALKLGVVGHFDNAGIFQRRNDFLGKHITAGKVNGLYRFIVEGVGEQKNLKIRRIAVSVHTALGQWRRAVCLQVQTHNTGHNDHLQKTAHAI